MRQIYARKRDLSRKQPPGFDLRHSVIAEAIQFGRATLASTITAGLLDDRCAEDLAAEVALVQRLPQDDLVGRLQLAQGEGLRQQLVQLIGRELGLSTEQVQDLSLRALAERFDEPRQGQLLTLSASIRERLSAIDAANKVAALVTGEMLKHYRQVYSAMARSGPSMGTYSAGGQLAADRPVQVFDAVG